MERLTENCGSCGYIIRTDLNYADAVVEMIQRSGQIEDLIENLIKKLKSVESE